MRKILFFLFCFIRLFGAPTQEKVILIHGFMGAPWNLCFLEKSLRKKGWVAFRFGYASRDKFIKDHAEQLVKELQQLRKKAFRNPIHFVAHSMGSLVLLAALNRPDCPKEAKQGKIVLIAPPLQGSCWGRWLYQFSVPKWIAKNYAGYELMTKENFEELGDFSGSVEKLLVISGSLSLNPFFKEPNDGILTLEETKPKTPHKHVILKRGHKTLIFSKKTAEHILQFLN